MTLVAWIVFIAAAEYAAGSLTAFLVRQPRWVTAVARFFGGSFAGLPRNFGNVWFFAAAAR